MESNPQPSDASICQRLFRLVFGALRRAEALPAPPSPSPSRPINVEGSEIVVELRHTTNSDDHVGKGKKSTVTFRKGKGSETRAMMGDQDETKTRRHWPLLGVASNINDKSEAFIESKKKAMGLDQDRTN